MNSLQVMFSNEPNLIGLYTAKWFQVLLFITINSIQHKWFQV